MDYQNYVEMSHKAAELVEAGDYSAAIEILQRLLTTDISDFDKAMMCANLAIVHEKLGQEQTALDWYDRGVAYEELQQRYHVAEMKAVYLADKGRTQESLNTYLDLLEHPSLTEADKIRMRQNVETLRRAQGEMPDKAVGELLRPRVALAQRRKSLVLLWLAAFLIVAGIVLIVLGANSLRLTPAEPPSHGPADALVNGLAAPVSSPTPEPLIPTRTVEPEGLVILTQTATSELTSTPTPRSVTPVTPLPTADAVIFTVTPTPGLTPVSPSPSRFIVPAHERFRLGVSLPGGANATYNLGALHVGWVMDWAARSSTALPPDVAYVPTVRLLGGELRPSAATLTAVAAARPGSTWLISNEPDVRWQDNVEPATYARLYHEAYTAIKAGDPAAVVAAGGIAQPTPLRLRYLDLVLDAYRNEFGTVLPAQAWQIHNYMLREERNSWGVDIPPGIPDDTGVLFSIADSGNLDIFRSQIYDFRRWMSSRGYGGQPLIISEFGVPMPEDYGFPPERMAEFLRETWGFFLTATDGSLGDPNDAGRLVQRWCWFSLADPTYSTGNLIDLESAAWTDLGRAWLELVK